MIPRFARPYARAFVDTAGGLEKALAARRELGAFAEAMAEVPAIGAMARNPGVPAEVKSRAVARIADALGVGGLARRLIDLLLAKYRLVHLPGVLAAIDELLDRARGIVTAEVTSADRLDEGQRGHLQAVLEARLGQQVQLRVSVDPELLGGFVALVGSERYDVSLRGQLERMTDQLVSAAIRAESA